MKNKKSPKLSREIFPGIFRIKLPLPFEKPGPVNVYLFRGKKNITLLDTGTAQGAGLLKKALKQLGLSFSDIDQIIITHGHIEHYGAAKLILEESGRDIKVGAFSEDVLMIKKRHDVPGIIYKKYLQLIGVPVSIRQFARLFMLLFRIMARTCDVDLDLRDGDKIKLGDYTGTVIHTPGHTKGSICIHLAEEQIVFSGDHILGHVTPNAFVMLDPVSPVPVRLSQVEYYNSISKIESLSPRIVYPAHSKEITDLAKITNMYRRNFTKRQKLILSIIASEELDAYNIARRLFPDVKGRKLPLDIFLAISEVYSHLQVLMKDGRVSSYKKGRRMIFKRSDS